MTTAYLSRTKLAAELDIAESTVDALVRRGVLPPPIKLTPGCVRWEWRAVQDAIASRAASQVRSPDDPYMAGVADAAKPST